MSFTGQMRLGSLEIVLALAAFAVFAGRVRAPGQAPSRADAVSVPQRVAFEVSELESVRRVERTLPVVVGRSSQTDLPLLDGEVSRRHARFDSEDGFVYVTDLGSRNGTYLNGERIAESIEVRLGDTIDIGNVRLKVVRL